MKLRDIPSHQTSLNYADQLALFAEYHCKLLNAELQHSGDLTETPIFRALHELIEFARDGRPLKRDFYEVITDMVAFYDSVVGPGSPLPQDSLPRRTPDGLYETIPSEPTEPLDVVITAAFARQKLDTRRPISAGELAVLVGLDRDRVLALAAAGDVPDARRNEKVPSRRGFPWEFPSTKKLKDWLKERGVPGIHR